MENTIQKTQKGAWQFVKQDVGGSVLITLNDGDTFGIPVDELVRACRSHEKLTEFARQVGELLKLLDQWLTERAPEIEKAHVSIDADGISLVVVRKDKAFNPAFEDALSSFDLEIAGRASLNLIRLRALALPYSSDATIASFLDISGGASLSWAPSF
jgi:hypothetical protein